MACLEPMSHPRVPETRADFVLVRLEALGSCVDGLLTKAIILGYIWLAVDASCWGKMWAGDYESLPGSPGVVVLAVSPGDHPRGLPQLRRHGAVCIASLGLVAVALFLAQASQQGPETEYWVTDEASIATAFAETGGGALEQQLPADVAKCMNFSTHPCDNFYEFVCGNWVKDAKIPASRGSWSKSWDGAGENVHDEMVSLYTMDWPVDSPYRRLHDWYASCMDLDHITEMGKK